MDPLHATIEEFGADGYTHGAASFSLRYEVFNGGD
jgi:hypothetical protein